MFAALLVLQVATANAPKVTLRGNVALPDELYHSVIYRAGLIQDLGLNLHDARVLARRVEDFLVDAGFELAEVRGAVSEDALRLTIDEGRLTRIIFKGQGDVTTVQLKLAVQTAQPVFHRPSLDRQLRELRRDFGITSITYELIPTQALEHEGPQLEDFGTLAGVPLVPPPGRYELHVLLGHKEWTSGWDLKLDIKAPDGVRAGLGYRGASLVFDDDRWQGGASLGVTDYPLQGADGGYAAVSRALADVAYATPDLFGLDLRPSLTGLFDYRMRSRADLSIVTYKWLAPKALLNVAIAFTPGITLRLGGGVAGRVLFDVQSAVGTTPPAGFEHVAAEIDLQSDFVFDPDRVRIDQHHELHLNLSLLVGPDAPPRFLAAGSYQKVFAFGWHELWLRARAMGQWGSVSFVDEESLAEFTRGVFGARYWMRRAGGGTAEFRFSLTRDLFKVGLFWDGVLFEKPGHGVAPHRLVFANAFGPSFHLLVLDTFQADAAVSIGISSEGFVEGGFSLNVRKAF